MTKSPQQDTKHPSSPAPQHPSSLAFLKLGGSLITDKTQPSTPRLEVLTRIAEEITAAREEAPNVRLILGHGSGSFGHVPASKYGTRQGVQTPEQWLGFAEVWMQASALTRLVIEALHGAGLPAVSFPASAGATAEDGEIISWNLGPVQAALEDGLLPVVNGDVVFDTARGGTILSTEDQFIYLARRLHPARILLAGLEPGVWADFPTCTQLIDAITPQNLEEVAPALSGSTATDVTGGMDSKVQQMLALVEELPGLEVRIFSGKPSGIIKQALLGAKVGTVLQSN